MTAKLTARQAAFVREYLVDLCAAKAAERAGYSPAGARYSAREIMKKPVVREAIEKAVAERAARTDVTADSVLQGLARVATSAETAGEFSAAVSAYSWLGRHLRLFTDKVELTGKNDGPVEYTRIERTIVDPKA